MRRRGSSGLPALALLLVLPLFQVVQAADWYDQFGVGTERILTSAGDADPYDPRTVLRGSGDIVLHGNTTTSHTTTAGGIAEFRGMARLYIAHDDPSAPHASAFSWRNLAMTAYAQFTSPPSENAPEFQGMTMAVRSNHDVFTENPCGAFGYYARIRRDTGQCHFLKEYFHISGGSVGYADTERVDCFPNQTEFPTNTWIGMKFVVQSGLGSNQVKLQLFVDRNESGLWELVTSFTDTHGAMPTPNTVPTQCAQNNGDPVLRPGNVCFLRSDNPPDEPMLWKNAAIVESPAPKFCADGLLWGDEDLCCGAQCGTCGGAGCSTRPGGAAVCCMSSVTSRTCAHEYDQGCRQPTQLCAAGLVRNWTSIGSAVCCHPDCGSCGGRGCTHRPGGVQNCCFNFLSHYGPTCVDPFDVACQLP